MIRRRSSHEASVPPEPSVPRPLSPSPLAIAMDPQAQRQVDRARRRLEVGDADQAAALLLDARSLGRGDSIWRDAARTTADQVLDRAEAAFDAGLLDAADQDLRTAVSLDRRSARLDSLRREMQAVRRVAALLRGRRYRRARITAQRLVEQRPAAAWLARLADRLDQLAQLADDVAASPIGAWIEHPPIHGSDQAAAAAPASAAASQAMSRPASAVDSRDEPGAHVATQPLRLSVDAVGSFLIWPAATITLGPTGAPGVDVPLVMDPLTPRLRLERDDDGEDLLLTQLAANGDEPIGTPRLAPIGQAIPLGARGRMRIGKPHPASNVFLLTFDGSRLPSRDVRGVLFGSGDIVIGPPPAHVRADLLTRQIVLARSRASDAGVTHRLRAVGAGADAETIDVPLERSVDFAGLSLRLSRRVGW